MIRVHGSITDISPELRADIVIDLRDGFGVGDIARRHRQHVELVRRCVAVIRQTGFMSQPGFFSLPAYPLSQQRTAAE